uniref:TNF receptor-associated factor 3 n=1 Tax=Schistosoma japonicum TaxID=6182 RepID=C1LGV8_SCHJA|nr:TNF receptor-associated factor 3 [Schistosoma japonicum]
MSETGILLKSEEAPDDSDEVSKETRKKQLKPKTNTSKNTIENYFTAKSSTENDESKSSGSAKSKMNEIQFKTSCEPEIIFVDQLDNIYRCVNCKCVLRVPFLFEDCGHRCCSGCVPDIFRATSKCPVDKQNLKKDRVHLDKAFQEQMDALNVRCSYYAEGCPWMGILNELGCHLNQCEYKIVLCPNECGTEFQRKSIEGHVKNGCPKRNVQCKFCGAKFSVEKEAKHISYCREYPLPCPNKCEMTSIPRSLIPEHLKNECSRQNLRCPFNIHGCEYRGRKYKMDQHLELSLIKHLNLLNLSVQQMSLLIEAQTKTYTEIRNSLEYQMKRITTLEQCFGPPFLWKIDSYSEKLNNARTGKQNALFSTPFYTHRFGYRMALSVSLYGNGEAKGKFMSVYACLFRGDHDSLLQWPFSHQLTFTLIDQNPEINARKPIVYTIKPSLAGDYNQFLGRPTGERNACFGAPRFVKLEVMEMSNYTINDEIYLKFTMNMDQVAPI